MYSRTSVMEIKALLEQVNRVVITMHRGPDGDAVGSTLGLQQILNAAGIEAVVVAPDDFPEFLKWMPGARDILIDEKQRGEVKKALDASDAIFCLDFNGASRMGALADVITSSNLPKVVIDHHQEPEPFADIYYVDSTASSTAEMVYRLMKSLNFKKYLDRQSAICLYTGIVTDTGSFRFSSASPKLMRIAGRLMETGIDHTEVYRNVFDSNTFTKLKLQGFALSEKLVHLEEAATAYISLSSEELNRFDFRKGDTEGLVNYALSIKGVNLAAFFSEKDGLRKISFRSKGNFNVNTFAKDNFNGGGHINAAGGRSEASMEETIARFEQLVREQADQIKASI